jgi:hypothetical protein
MKIYNLDGTTVFAPGSEWLWAMKEYVALVLTSWAAAPASYPAACTLLNGAGTRLAR